MSQKEIGLVNKIIKKNIKDIVILGFATILIIAIIFLTGNKIILTGSVIIIMLLYYIQCQISNSGLIKTADKLINNELNEFQKVSVKVLQLSEKQKSLTNKYNEMINNLIQNTKLYKNISSKTTDKTQNITSKTNDTYNLSEKEITTLNNNIMSMKNLKHKVQMIAELIIELTEHIKQTGSMVSAVETISEQTNMLALNAAVEAARAGEYGKGFAVVAGEIRKLADESKQATNKITSLISEIEQTTSSTIMATEDSAKEIENSINYANNLCNDYNIIVNNIKDLTVELNDIIASLSEQNIITSDIIETVGIMQNTVSDYINTTENNIENIKTVSEISTNIKDNIAS